MTNMSQWDRFSAEANKESNKEVAVIDMTKTLPKFKDLMAGLAEGTNEPTELTFNDYQKVARTTAVFPGNGTVAGPMYLALGLCGEAGEVAEKIKKLFRDGYPKGVEPDDWTEDLIKEVGDVLWYASNLLDAFGVSFSDAGVTNLEKLASRQARGVLGGSGDNR
jgi:NTP pyrophosphatase (non-canonical NTP hydrolase)